MASNAHQPGSKVRALESLTTTMLAEVRYEWRGHGGSGSVSNGGQVEDEIVVKRIQCPKVADGF